MVPSSSGDLVALSQVGGKVAILKVGVTQDAEDGGWFEELLYLCLVQVQFGLCLKSSLSCPVMLGTAPMVLISLAAVMSWGYC